MFQGFPGQVLHLRDIMFKYTKENVQPILFFGKFIIGQTSREKVFNNFVSRGSEMKLELTKKKLS